MTRLGPALAAALAAVSTPAVGSADGGRADAFAMPAPNAEHPLSIVIESGIQVGRLGLTGYEDGHAAIDPQTGAKQVGPNMIDLGGWSFQGKATITAPPITNSKPKSSKRKNFKTTSGCIIVDKARPNPNNAPLSTTVKPLRIRVPTISLPLR